MSSKSNFAHLVHLEHRGWRANSQGTRRSLHGNNQDVVEGQPVAVFLLLGILGNEGQLANGDTQQAVEMINYGFRHNGWCY